MRMPRAAVVLAGLGAVLWSAPACSLADLSGLSAGGAGGGASTSSSSSVTTSSAGGAGGDLAGGSGAGAGGDGGAGGGGPCPSGRGPEMVLVPTAQDPYCIDSTEVTVAHYLAFRDAAALDASLLAEQPAICEGNLDFGPPSGWTTIFADITQASEQDDPIRIVDWCDARAFCAWSGKRLCGARGGASLTISTTSELDEASSDWVHACSAGGTKTYPFGEQPSPLPGDWPDGPSGVCVDDRGPFGVTEYELLTDPVGSNLGCEGGFPGLHDMSGNSAEWLDACTAGGDCATIGGSSNFQANATFCEFAQLQPRDLISQHVGFRCCATPE